MGKWIVAVLMLLTAHQSFAQQAAMLSKNAMAIKRKADHLSLRARISVVPLHAKEEFGEFVSNDQESFIFYDVDLKTDVRLRYEDVRKIKDGYGGYNSLRRTHTDHTKAIVVALVVTGLLVGVIVAAAASK